MQFRTIYDKIKNVVQFIEPTKTQQQFEEECNINNIVKRYKQTGIVTHLAHELPAYGDFSEVPDYQTAFDIVVTAQDNFMRLPADLRKRFDNDPAQMLEFLQDESNYEEAVKLGLLARKADEGLQTSGTDSASNVSDNASSNVSGSDS